MNTKYETNIDPYRLDLFKIHPVKIITNMLTNIFVSCQIEKYVAKLYRIK
jgi:hypothetical protein